jgi:hypothetical protein
MSTIKVNQIEPYSGGVVTITGFTAESASHAATAMSASYANFSTQATTATWATASLWATASMDAISASFATVALTASYVDGAILNYPDADGTTPTINRMVSMTSASYAALDPKDANTFYVII